MMREFTGQKDMVRLVKTRFATAFLILRSFHKHKANLRRMFTSDKWSKSKFAKEQGAGHYLNPQFYYNNPTIEQDQEVMSGLWKCIERLVLTTNVIDEIGKELRIYARAEGTFEYNAAKRHRTILTPSEWWASFGSSTPNLQKFAIKVLSLTCSSSDCERNWSDFEHMKDESNEWLVGKVQEENEEEDESMYGNADFWAEVGHAIGAAEEEYTLRSQSSHSMVATSSKGRGKSFASTVTISSRGKGKGKSKLIEILENDEEEEFSANQTDMEEEEEKDSKDYVSHGLDVDDEINLEDEDDE
ncbi:hypothetical protein Cni_G10588 [Canna indica]|uniref:HAT C-terminal dimerisation domain-containing protein n=1 Tax=Canna indica TaxID=4628 RepID=A0AAQ3K4D5_9LILI|nr:hypothetical protein Cni_G10588 [Canna indica]